jgi:hypothetical protein
MRRALRLLAPYVAVGIFWCGLHNGWLAILAYHAQILFWGREWKPAPGKPGRSRLVFLALPTLAAGPLLYVLLPHMTHTDLTTWLAVHGLSRRSLMLMVPYFGLLHPVLEQIHWAPLRGHTWLAHPLFAGYHMLVLHSLITSPWLVVCFAVLTAASVLWHRMVQSTGCPLIPIISQLLADLGIVLVAWLH